MDTITVIDPKPEEHIANTLTDEDFITTYVPEAAEMRFDEALELALERSDIAAGEFEDSMDMAEAIVVKTTEAEAK